MGRDLETLLAEQRRRAAVSRDNLVDQWDRTRARVAPDRLKQDVVDSARQLADDTKAQTAQTARAHPVFTGTVALTALAWVFRKPLRRQYDHAKPDLYSRGADAIDWLSNKIRTRKD